MLFPYNYPKHKIQKIQSFVNYIMLEVVLAIHKFPDKQVPLDQIVSKYLALIQGVSETVILYPMTKMYEDARELDRFHRKIIRKAVLENNKVEELCNKKELYPVRYSYMNSRFTKPYEKDMIENIKLFCNNLYEICLRRSSFYSTYGKIKDYHDILIGTNSVCGFCGRDSLHIKFSKLRNAFDHYLPKSKYPFVSVNFHNLVPACTRCNSDYKRSTDILYKGKERIKAFYPFTAEKYEIHIGVHLKKSYRPDITPNDIELTFACEGHDEEVNNWLRIYHIAERYKEYCCTLNVRETLSMLYTSTRNSIEDTIQKMILTPKVDMHFLLVPFLEEALRSLGINVA